MIVLWTASANISPDSRWGKLMRSFRSDAEFHAAFEHALKHAVERFVAEYSDKELASALIHSTHFWDLPQVQNALKEIIRRPSSYLETERNILFASFADVLPAVEPDRVERTVSFFMRCLAQEVITIPQLAPIYQVYLQKVSLDQGQQMVSALRELQADQRQWMTGLIELVSQGQLLLASPDNLSNMRTIPKIHQNLPPLFGDFLGREDDVARILDGLQSQWPLISIEGIAGIGKTTLAIKTAQRCLPEPNAAIVPPFEVVVWVSAGDRPEQKQWMNEVLDTVARVLGYRSVLQVPPEQKSAEVNYLLRHHRTLVIVDNFETIDDAELLEWIQRVPVPSKALITTRHHDLRRVWDVHLKGLGKPEALELIRHQARRLGLRTIEREKEDILLPLVSVTEGNPQIIEMALGYIKSGSLSLEEVVEHLYAASMTVDGIFDYLFARAWDLMTDNAQHVLLAVPLFASSVDKKALGAISGLMDYPRDSALQQLVDLALLDINEEQAVSGQRYSVHPLTRAFASKKLLNVPEYEKQARQRWTTYYVEFAAQNLVRESAKESYWNVLTKRGNKLIDQDWPNLRQVLTWVDEQGHDATLIDLMFLLVHYMYRRILYTERIYFAQRAAEAASRLNRKEEEAFLRIDALGWLLIEEGLFADAQRELMTGLAIAQSMPIEDSTASDLIALATTFLSRSYLEQGDIDNASELINQALAVNCSPIVECRVYMVAGDVAYSKNNYLEAIRLYEHATRITQAEEDVDFDARLHYCLGSAYLADGDLVRAESEFSIVLDIEQQAINIVLIYAKYGLARVALAKGDREKTQFLAQEAREELSRSIASHQLLGQIENLLKALDTQ